MGKNKPGTNQTSNKEEVELAILSGSQHNTSQERRSQGTLRAKGKGEGQETPGVEKHLK